MSADEIPLGIIWHSHDFATQPNIPIRDSLFRNLVGLPLSMRSVTIRFMRATFAGDELPSHNQSMRKSAASD
jgi:hypothetical protein